MKKKLIIFLMVVLVLLIVGCSQSNPQQETKGNAVHLHPKLTIIIDGEQVPIPDDIGSRTGKIVDTHLSGMRMSPTHTHESDGTIHVENNNPTIKPETLTLGYFFFVWDKTFNSECIFDHCTDKGTLTMVVNGNKNTEFENYVMQDGDDIVIEYKTNRG
jgi:hypothetical protein